MLQPSQPREPCSASPIVHLLIKTLTDLLCYFRTQLETDMRKKYNPVIFITESFDKNCEMTNKLLAKKI